MTFFEAAFLGLVQGVTEFIPVSSSGHLLLAHEIFGTAENSLAFDVALHAGTLMALFVVFRSDIVRLARNLFKSNEDGQLSRLIVYATIPAALAGLLFGGFIDDNARTALVVACTLAVVGIGMLIAEKYASSSGDRDKAPTTKQGMAVGFAQAFALIPGVSRSGATITTGFFMGMGKQQATRFSFLLSIPIITGSAVGILLRNGNESVFDMTLLAGVLAAFLSGLVAIKFMLNIIGKVGLKPFAYYRIILAALVIIFLV